MRTFTRLLSIAIVFLLLVTPKDLLAQTMWPGDVNNNGIVNGVDALYWNTAIGATGTLRPNATTDWDEQDLPDPLWGTTMPNGLDHAYADCDGNGIIDEADFLNGIIDNCRKTHGTLTPDVYLTGIVGVDPKLSLVPETAEAYSGEILNVDINLGDTDIDVEDFKAITFTMSYDSEFVEDNNNFMLDLSESWVDPSGTGEGTASYIKTFDDIETGEVTILKTASSIQNGAGKIGRVSIVIEDNIIGLVTNDTLVIQIKDIKMINEAGDTKKVAPDAQAKVKILEPRSSTNCPQIVNPVCGDNGVTYINCCYAAAAGVTNFTTGVCYSGCIDEAQMNPNANCSYTYNPVCGCNDVTYLNSCVAQANGVMVYTQGACTDNCYDPTYVDICGQTSTDPVSGVVNLLCPQASVPVCGCDGITYTNSCYAQASGMSFYTPGPCANNCVDPHSMDPNLICPSAYEPVCGCNGVNYSNSCYADAAGVLNYTPGTCGSSTWCSEATPISCGDFMPNETTVGSGNNIVNYPGCTSQSFAGPDKVYVINKNTSGDLQIGIEIMTPGMDLDMFLLVDDCNQVTCVKSSTTSNNTSNNEGIIYEDAPIGTYYLVIDGQYAASEGNFRLEVNCGYLNCDNSVHLTCGVPVNLNNSTGTDEVSLYGCDGNVLNVENNGPEMIHTFTTTTAGPVNVSLYGLTANLELFMLRSCDRGDCIDYSQNPGNSNEEIEAYLQPGTYYVVVDGYNGGVCDYTLLVNCAANCTYDINATASEANCGQNNGSINITSSGGIPGFIIQWEGPVSGSFSTYGTNCTVSGLPGGNYTVTATDANGCEDTAIVTIGNSETNLNVSATPNDAVCMDQGSISVSIVNGSPYYQIFINGPTSGSTTTSLSTFNIVNLDPGTYTLQIVDANGCSNTQEVVIGQSPGNFNWTYTVTNAACGGTGSIHVATQNGIPNYNIIVSGPTSGSASTSSSSFNINELPGGTYDITVEDGNWCQITKTITIEDSNLTIGLDANTGYCGSSGSIVVNMSNGNPGYTVNWSGPSSGTGSVSSSSYTIPNLVGGAYSVTVTDASGCTDYQVITLYNSSGSIDFDMTAANGSCGQPGSIWLGITSGISPYTITWSGPASGTITTPYTNYDIPWLPNGTYSVQVTDADGCSTTQEITINNSMNNLEINTTPSDGICDQPGSIWVSISNGTPGYSLSWSGASNGSTTTNNASYDIQNLVAGDYTITLTDGGGCQTTTDVTVGNETSNLTVTATPLSGACGNAGTIDLAIANGAGGNYSISWSGESSGSAIATISTYSLTDLAAGTYTITVSDENLCSTSTTVTLTNGTNDLAVTGFANNGACGNTGSVDLTISGGAGSYTVAWSGAGTGNANANGYTYTIADAASGTYNIVITDSEGCTTTTAVVVLNGLNYLSVSGTRVNGVCGNTGSIDLILSGGTGAYAITWSGAGIGAATANGNTYTITDAVSGNYDIIVTDAAGCTSNTSVAVANEPNNVAVSNNVNNGICGNAGSIDLTLSGGTGGYSVSWSGAATGSGNANGNAFTITNAATGVYNITVTDGEGCVTTTAATIDNSSSNFSITGTSADGTCNNPGSLWIYMDGGTANYTVEWDGPVSGSVPTTADSYDVQGTPSGTYLITVTDANGCVATTTIVVNNSSSNFSITGTSADGTCNNPGSLWIYMDGGTANYTVEWDGPVSGSAPTTADSYDVQGTPSGTYLVTVTDANGCVATTTIVVNSQGSNLAVTGTASNGVCGSNGSILLSMTGGNSPYSITYAGAATGSTTSNGNTYNLTGAVSGTYNFSVTDADGCSASTVVVVNNGNGNAGLTVTPTNGACGQSGHITVITTGTAPYTINWTGAGTGTASSNGSYVITNANAGSYTVSITDANGCTATQSTSVSNGGNVVATATTHAANCTTGVGSIDVAIASGSPSYTVVVTGPTASTSTQFGNSFTLNDLVAGTYSIVITDADNCSTTITEVVDGAGCCMSVSMTGVDAQCGTNGSIWIDVYNGATDYTVTWTGTASGTNSIGIDNFEIPNLPSGAYVVTVVGADGCSITQNVTVNSTGSIAVSGTGNSGACGGNGSATINVTGGAASYNASWTGAANGSNTYTTGTFTVPNLPIGNYTFTVTDGNNCTASTTVTINAGVNNLSGVATAVDASCESTNGSISVALTGGTPGYTVVTTGPTSSSTTQNGSSFNVGNLVPGAYSILITDANGCGTTLTATVAGPGCCMSSTMTGVDAKCGQNGSIWIDMFNGTTDYTVTWTGTASGTNSIGIDNFEIPNLPGGTYIVTVVDAAGCSVTQTVTVNSTGGITVTAAGNAGVCGGNGSANITVTGGAPTYNVSWTGAAVGSSTYNNGNFTIPNLAAGTYIFSVTDGNGCTGSQTVTISGGANTLTATSSTNAADCASGLGSVTIAVAGGTPNYTVTATNGTTTNTTTQSAGTFTLGSLAPGSYDISISDANGCYTSLTALVGGPGCCMTANMTGVDATCGANGSVWIDVFNGATDYTVTWTGPSSGTNSIGIDNFEIPNLPGGNYSITVTDNNNCTVTQNVTVNSTGGVDVTLTPVDGDCGQNGSIWIDVNTGTPNFTVTWTGTTAGSNTTDLTNFEIPNLPAGTYVVTIADANGCTSTSTINVTTGAGTITATTSSTAADCTSGVGSVAVVVAGGTPNYSVTVDGTTTTQTGNAFTLGGLAPGTYTIAIADANGCSTAVTVVVGGPGCCMTATMTGVDAGCGTNGSIWIDVFNGTPNYMVMWNGPSSGSNSINLDNFEIPNLPGGDYSITITDNNNCTVTQNVTINVSGSIDITANAIAGTCGGNGAANVNILSGTPSFTVSWDGPVVGSNTTNANAYTIADLPAGVYVITVVDADGCSDTGTITVTTGANTLSATAVGGNADCISGLGQIAVSVANGTPGYTVTTVGASGTITTTQTTNGFNLTGLLPGNYTVTIVDESGCSTTVGTTITNTACCMTTALTGVNGTCGSPGSILVTVANGAPNYTITWTGGGAATATTSPYTITNVAAGTYTVTVVDANGCSNTGNITIATTPAVIVTASANPGACGAAGSADITIAGGTPGYTITGAGVSVASNGGTTNIPNLAAGNYTFTVTDANGCTGTQVVTITTGANNLSATAVGGNADCISGLGQIAVTVANGVPGYTVTTVGASGTITTTQTANGFNLTGLLPGNYTVTIVDANGCSTTVGTTITDTECCMTTALTGVDGACGSPGSILVAVANGTPDYTISLTGSGSTISTVTTSTSPYTYTNVGAGTYSVTVVDANGCTNTGSVSIATTPAVTFTATANAGACGTAGSADITITGGTPGYTIVGAGTSVASNGGTTNIPNLAAGNYTFTVTDANGCTATQVVTVTTGTNNLTATAVGGNADCVSGLGQIAVAVSNGAPNYTVTTVGASGTNTTTQTTNGFNLTGLLPGNYTVTIVDANGCSTTIGTTITDTACCMTTALASVDGICGGAGAIVATIANGAPGYTVTLSQGGTTLNTATTNTSPYTFTGIAAGTYTVTVVDVNGCTNTGSVSVVTTPATTFTATANAGACGAAGSVDVSILSGTPGFTITIGGITVVSNGGTTNIPNIAPGTYPVSVTDANGCTASQSVTITTGTNDLTATAIGSNADCSTGLGHISIAIANGVPNYTITAVGPSGSTTTSTVGAFNLEDLLPGGYTITIVDANGCSTTVTATVGDGFCCFTATMVGTDATCGPDGSIAITTASGTAPYTITYPGGTPIVIAGPNGSVTGLAAGTYVVTITDAAGCDVTQTVVIGGSSITATASGSTAACLTGFGTITGTATGTAPYSILISGVGSTTVQTSPFTLTQLLPGTYNLTITDANGCVANVITGVTILPVDECCMTANFVSTAATCDTPGEVCVEVLNGLADFTAAYTGTGSGTIISSAANFCIPDLATGSYNITVTDAAGCTAVQSVVVADECCISDACFAWSENSTNIDFTSNHTSATASYVWTFGDGSTGAGANPSHAYPGSGNYDVCVTVTEGCGSETCCETIQVANGMGTVIIRAGLAAGGTGNTVSIPVTSENCDILTSFSASLTTCDESIAQIVGITPSAINPLFNSTNNTFTYFDFNGEGVPCDDVVLFYIDVLLVGTGGQSCDIMITCEPLPCEVGGLENGTGVVVDHVVMDGTITIYNMFQMNGMVRTFWMDGIMDAQVEADGNIMDEMDMTDSSGVYLFPELIGDEEYIVEPEKDTLPANGLSTFALYIGQQFILGMDPVEVHSPYQVIAGDANCNNSFTALDLFLIQQIIIGTATEFPSCPSWVFVNEEHPLPADFNTYNVFPYESTATMQLDQDSYANFVGVKVGDILGNANPHNRPTTATDTRDRSEITFNALNGAVRAGESFTLDFTSADFEDFVSFQMALTYAKDKMRFIEVIENQNSEMSNLISGISPNNDDQVRFSWFNLNGKATSLTNTEVAFSVKFEATTDIADLSELFAINKFDTFNAEAHNQYSEPFNIVLEFVDPASTETEIANGDYKLLQNIPNPFTNSTVIRFELPAAMDAKLTVTNTLGQVVAQFANEFPKGISQVEWNRKDLPSGLYNYTLTTDSYSESRSMIIID